MARPREFDTEQALARIADVFWEVGYEATSITDLEEATGLARARLYAAYGSKVDMLHLAMDHYLDRSLEPIFARVEVGGLDGIVGWFSTMAELRRVDPGKATRGCLVVNSLVERANTDPEVSARGDRYRARVRKVFTNALRTAHDAGDIDGGVEERATLLVMLLLGMFTSIKGAASPESVGRDAAAAVDLVNSWRVPAASR
ncbi:MAG: TetR/AcrR family transcriptional regulator [Actinomycetota bacterium]